MLLLFRLVLAFLAFEVFSPAPADLGTEMAMLINVERAEAGVGQLQSSGPATIAAQARVADMWARGYFGHLPPGDPRNYTGELAAAGIESYTWAGENLVRTAERECPGQTHAECGMAILMNSPTHRENTLFPEYNAAGIGWECRDGVCLVAVVFVALRGAE